MLGKFDTSGLRESFRLIRNQNEERYTPPKEKSAPKKKRNVSSDKYQSFLNKYWDLENSIETFNAQDLMYFFREKANENGVKYVIANMKRDLGIFKRLQANYTNQEICLMVEFMFCSEQDYLDRSRLQPTILVSSYCNTIYQDALLWLDDEYTPKTQYKRKSTKDREWGSPKSNKATIGEW